MTKYVRMFKWLVVLLAGGSFVLSVTFLPYFAESVAWRFPEYDYLLYPVLFFLWATLIGFYYMVVLVINILGNVQSGKAFTITTAKLFDRIALMAFVEIIAYVLGFVAVSICIMKAHPYFIFAVFIVTFICLALMGFCKIMNHLLLRVVDIKEENDYTV